ncbi:Plasminogen [Clonorchis sinensis]|uniref:Plasminogen n=1 Tax=Clonorchis sinensis TaxID=79923 RepID=A0A8T1MVY0_CLOSI|nr:Plasminogen [Clonorchis sinensis]
MSKHVTIDRNVAVRSATGFHEIRTGDGSLQGKKMYNASRILSTEQLHFQDEISVAISKIYLHCRPDSLPQVLLKPVPVLKVHNHTWGYDIGLIRLNEPLDISGPDVRAADIPNTANLPAESSILTFVGFGQTCDKTLLCERKPNLVHLTVEREQRWRRRYGHFGAKFLDRTFGALSDKGQRTYRGDSGGGLILSTNDQQTVVGIASGSPKEENIQAPAIIVRVASHLPWIHEILRKTFPSEQLPKAGGLTRV